MTSRMEKVAKDVALAALRSASTASDPPLDYDALKEVFQAKWPTKDSQRPMKDAMSASAQAASRCSGQDADSWNTAISRTWQTAVEEVVEEYFKAAEHSFEKGEALEAVETLTDAVRATLGQIAAVRDWPHGSQDNLYRIAAALGSGREWPNTPEDFNQALDNASEDGNSLGAALGASMGRPDMLTFGAYAENPDGPKEDGFLFATTTIQLANRLAGRTIP